MRLENSKKDYPFPWYQVNTTGRSGRRRNLVPIPARQAGEGIWYLIRARAREEDSGLILVVLLLSIYGAEKLV